MRTLTPSMPKSFPSGSTPVERSCRGWSVAVMLKSPSLALLPKLELSQLIARWPAVNEWWEEAWGGDVIDARVDLSHVYLTSYIFCSIQEFLFINILSFLTFVQSVSYELRPGNLSRLSCLLRIWRNRNIHQILNRLAGPYLEVVLAAHRNPRHRSRE